LRFVIARTTISFMASLHRKTCKRYDIPGDVHFITFSCFRRLPLLAKDRSRGWLLDAIALARAKQQFHLWAYVIMPEHAHVVIWPQQARISEILTTIKQSTSKSAINWLQKHSPEFLAELVDCQPNGRKAHRVWQRGGGYDRNLRSVRDLYEKIRYVHENPVHRGLVASAVDWPWSSARAWASGVDEPLAIDRDSLPRLSNLDVAVDSSLLGWEF
jgi:putative transposase